MADVEYLSAWTLTVQLHSDLELAPSTAGQVERWLAGRGGTPSESTHYNNNLAYTMYHNQKII